MPDNPYSPPRSVVEDVEASDANNRPKAVSLAFWLIVGSTAIEVLDYLLTGMVEPLGTTFIGWALPLFLAFQMRTGGNWARIAYVFLYMLGLSLLLFALAAQIREGVSLSLDRGTAGSIIVTCMQGYALWLVFRFPGKEWFKADRDQPTQT